MHKDFSFENYASRFIYICLRGRRRRGPVSSEPRSRSQAPEMRSGARPPRARGKLRCHAGGVRPEFLPSWRKGVSHPASPELDSQHLPREIPPPMPFPQPGASARTSTTITLDGRLPGAFLHASTSASVEFLLMKWGIAFREMLCSVLSVENCNECEWFSTSTPLKIQSYRSYKLNNHLKNWKNWIIEGGFNVLVYRSILAINDFLIFVFFSWVTEASRCRTRVQFNSMNEIGNCICRALPILLYPAIYFLLLGAN